MFRFMILLFYAVIVAESFTCPPGFDQVSKEDTCLITIGDVKNYFDADRKCRSLDAQVAKIENVFENSYIFALLSKTTNNTDPYIGIEKKPSGEWTYADGSTLVYRNWAEGEPKTSNNASFCAVMDATNGRWKTDECAKARPFVCSINNGDPYGDCPTDWLDFEGNCYYLQNFTLNTTGKWETYTFADAEKNCRELGAHLASIHSQAEDNFLFNLAFFNSANSSSLSPYSPCDYYTAAPWIGLLGTGSPSTSQWTDGTTVDYLSHPLSTSGQTNWQVFNDQSCNKRQWIPNSYPSARFFCKVPSKKSKSASAANSSGQKPKQKETTFVCPNGFTQFPEENICSTSVNKSLYYVDVIRQCDALDSMVVKIQNIFENNYLFGLLPSNVNQMGPYIGVERKPDGSWTYADGSALTYQNWDVDEPNAGSSSNCAMMNPANGRWKSSPCSIAKPSICSTNEYVNRCPFGWSYLAKASACYYLNDFTLEKYNNTLLYYTFGNAETLCKAMGNNAHLVSVHSREELDFLYEMIYSNVSSLPDDVTTLRLCDITGAWTGMYTNTDGLIIGTWTDQSAFDYIPYPIDSVTTTYNWQIENDYSCNLRQWTYWSRATAPRFVCKMPSL